MILMATNVILINYPKDTDQARYRVIINTVSAIIILVIVGAFELRQLVTEKGEYFK